MGANGLLAVDGDELCSGGTGLLRAGDAVHATAARGALLGKATYGGVDLTRASDRFADRYTYLLNELGDEVLKEGRSMRGFAFAYAEADAMAGDALTDVAAQMP
ncbi:MAG: hypothetical protein HGA44_10825 [Cellulomonadaceae bacterium]|nr:hypothetical protein [Cellulomonadaceae bacterium]